VLVSRESHLRSRAIVLTVPVTTRVRGLPTEIPLGPEDGLSKFCVADAGSVQRTHAHLLERRLAVLSQAKRGALNDALRFALGLD
jgi:mRNA-degrading endonuclease toxin of MazEF toxin-antitoxin module